MDGDGLLLFSLIVGLMPRMPPGLTTGTRLIPKSPQDENCPEPSSHLAKDYLCCAGSLYPRQHMKYICLDNKPYKRVTGRTVKCDYSWWKYDCCGGWRYKPSHLKCHLGKLYKRTIKVSCQPGFQPKILTKNETILLTQRCERCSSGYFSDKYGVHKCCECQKCEQYVQDCNSTSNSICSLPSKQAGPQYRAGLAGRRPTAEKNGPSREKQKSRRTHAQMMKKKRKLVNTGNRKVKGGDHHVAGEHYQTESAIDTHEEQIQTIPRRKLDYKTGAKNSRLAGLRREKEKEKENTRIGRDTENENTWVRRKKEIENTRVRREKETETTRYFRGRTRPPRRHVSTDVTTAEAVIQHTSLSTYVPQIKSRQTDPSLEHIIRVTEHEGTTPSQSRTLNGSINIIPGGNEIDFEEDERQQPSKASDVYRPVITVFLVLILLAVAFFVGLVIFNRRRKILKDTHTPPLSALNSHTIPVTTNKDSVVFEDIQTFFPSCDLFTGQNITTEFREEYQRCLNNVHDPSTIAKHPHSACSVEQNSHIFNPFPVDEAVYLATDGSDGSHFSQPSSFVDSEQSDGSGLSFPLFSHPITMEELEKNTVYSAINETNLLSIDTSTQTSLKQVKRNNILGGDWDRGGMFDCQGGCLETDESDVKLIVPENAVGQGMTATVARKVFTNLKDFVEIFDLTKEDRFVSPVVEFVEGGSVQFETHLTVKIPIASSFTQDAEMFRVLCVPGNGDLKVREVPMYTPEFEQSRDMVYVLRDDGFADIYTKHFTLFACTACSTDRQLRLDGLVFGRCQLTESLTYEADVRLYICDSLHSIKDFKKALESEEKGWGRKPLDGKTIRLNEPASEEDQLLCSMESTWNHATRLDGSFVFSPDQEVKLSEVVQCHIQTEFPPVAAE